MKTRISGYLAQMSSFDKNSNLNIIPVLYDTGICWKFSLDYRVKPDNDIKL